MYIPRPAKLLFTIDDGLRINSSKNTAITLVRGRVYLWSACTCGTVPWNCPAIVALRLMFYSRFSAKAVSQKKAWVHVALEATEQCLTGGFIFYPTATGNTLLSPMHISAGLLTITGGRYLMLCFGQPLELCCSWLANKYRNYYFLCLAYLWPATQSTSACSCFRHSGVWIVNIIIDLRN
ncbi:hypothetical protein QE193_23470 (plasmid) [Arsenophonus nasoniae]|nr:hypothetical protein [Arsenophonus nasoniae]WGM18171.1 hypothetical protein QE193_23470 [Arsenophonus nasoniae]